MHTHIRTHTHTGPNPIAQLAELVQKKLLEQLEYSESEDPAGPRAAGIMKGDILWWWGAYLR